MKKITFLFAALILFVFGANSQGLENFDNCTVGSGYSDGSFVGEGSITWYYVQSRDGNGDANGSGISLPALMLRRVSDGSKVYSETISGGIGNFSIKLYKGFTGGGNRQVELFINDVSKGTSVAFDDFDEHVFTVNNINISGNIVIRIDNITSKQIIVDDITWTAFASGGNQPPAISDISNDPEIPLSTESVTVQADVTDDDGVEEVNCIWGTSDSGPYNDTITMSLDAGDTYETDSPIPAQLDGTTVYYVIEGIDDEPDTTQSAQQSYTVTDPATTTLPYNETFDTDLGECYTYSVSGDTKEWEWYSSDQAAGINGWDSGDIEEDWLILPAIDIDNNDDVIMTFETWWKYASDDNDHYLKLMYSTDYSGLGDPSGSTWQELPFHKPSILETWTNSLPVYLDSISGTSVYLAFKYRYTDGQYRTWKVDNIHIYEGTPIDVTFQVNMAEADSISAAGIHVAGNFNNWDPAATEMLDGDLDDVYEVTLTLYEGEEYQYKYINFNAWAGEETVPPGCVATNTSNRFEVIESANYSIDPVCFGACVDCNVDSFFDVTFRVNMQEVDPVDGDGVFIAGSFTTWGDSAMTNTSGNIWEVTFSLAEGTSYLYKFKNGHSGWEDNSGAGPCTNGAPDYNRTLTGPNTNTVLDLVCFESCDVCPAPPIIISEVSDPGDNANARFVELYNPGTSPVDFAEGNWYLSKEIQTGNISDVALSGTVAAGATYVIAASSSNFTSAYGFAPDQAHGDVNANGDDSYVLYYGGDHTDGVFIDVYGDTAVDGSGTDWDYENSKAVRLRSIDSPNDTWTIEEWDIPGKNAGDVKDMTPGEHKSDVTWAGTTDSDWHAKGNNWSGPNGYIPDASFDVTIPAAGNDPIITSGAACNNLTVQSDASLTVAVGGFLTTYEMLDIASFKSRAAGNFTIQSDANGNGSFIGKWMMLGEVTVERYIEEWTVGNDGWHLIGSPIDWMTIAGSDLEPGDNDDLYEWMEQTSTWHNYKPSPGTFAELRGGQGYLVAYENTATKHFTGQLTGWDFDFDNLRYTPTEGNGWNLMGNPYPSAIEWNTPDWNLDRVGGTAKVLNEASGNYEDVLAGDVIPSTNGFFVQVDTNDNFLTIPASARVHDATNNYKSKNTEEMEETLVLKVTNNENTYYDINRIGFKDEATEAWDIEYDSHKLYGRSTAPQLWTMSNDEQFSLNYLPYVYDNYQLPLYFRAGVNATHQINVEGIDSFFGNSEIYLEDLLLDQMIDLREEQQYSFMASTGDDEGRFVIHFYGVTSTGDNLEVDDNTSVYASQNTIFIKSDQMPKGAYQVDVINVLGQTVYSSKVSPSTLSSFQLNQKTGVYFVKVKTDQQTIVQKVIINN